MGRNWRAASFYYFLERVVDLRRRSKENRKGEGLGKRKQLTSHLPSLSSRISFHPRLSGKEKMGKAKKTKKGGRKKEEGRSGEACCAAIIQSSIANASRSSIAHLAGAEEREKSRRKGRHAIRPVSTFALLDTLILRQVFLRLLHKSRDEARKKEKGGNSSLKKKGGEERGGRTP